MLETLVRHLHMVRLTARRAALLAAVVLTVLGGVGCTGLIDDGGETGLTPEQKIARQKWLERALPALTEATCTTCHSVQTGIDFLAGSSPDLQHDRAMSFDPPVVNTDAPASSRILTKNAHAGPALGAAQSGAILEWIQAEKDAVGSTGSAGPTLETEPFVPQMCSCGGAQSCTPGDVTGCGTGGVCCPYNRVDLTKLGLPGATIAFIAAPIGASDLYVHNLFAQASIDGTYIEHPLFVSHPPAGAMAVPDGLDRFFSVKMNLEMAMTPAACPPFDKTCDQIGGGTAAFIGFVPTNPITIHFKAIEKFRSGDGSGSGGGGGGGDMGCKKLTEFKTNAQTQLRTNCASCHAGTANPQAVASMKIDGIASTDDAMILAACNQVRSRINFQTTDQSGFYIAPNPAQMTNHPFKFGGNQANFNTFKAAVDVWVQAEKTAP
jgi:hypothetical protein